MDFGGEGGDFGGNAPESSRNGIKSFPTYPQDFGGTNYKPPKYVLATPTKVHGDNVDRFIHVAAQEKGGMGEVHKLIEQGGREQALKSELPRTVVEAAAAYLAAEDAEIGFLYSGWCQAALPHKRLPDDEVWQINTDHTSLMVSPGHRPNPGGPAIPIGVPYGSRARLILLYLQSEALRTNSREVELGRSMNTWLRRMDIPLGGKSARDVRDQAERISRCRMTFQIQSGTRRGLLNQSILDTAMFLEDDAQGAQGTLLLETARLSETFYEHLRRHPVPVEEAAIRGLANNSMALDVYCWLAYRLHALEEPKLVTWKALHAQFGRGVQRLDHFRKLFRTSLDLALAVYPAARVEPSQPGLLMHPSRPPVGSKVVAITNPRRKA